MRDAKIMLNKTATKINQEKRSVRQILTLSDWKCNELSRFFALGDVVTFLGVVALRRCGHNYLHI